MCWLRGREVGLKFKLWGLTLGAGVKTKGGTWKIRPKLNYGKVLTVSGGRQEGGNMGFDTDTWFPRRGKWLTNSKQEDEGQEWRSTVLAMGSR